MVPRLKAAAGSEHGCKAPCEKERSPEEVTVACRRRGAAQSGMQRQVGLTIKPVAEPLTVSPEGSEVVRSGDTLTACALS